jgi:hypothetical protein
MAKVHGIEFNSNQAELVKSLIRELLKDGNCAVYALPHMKPDGELRMACTPPAPSPRHQHAVFLRIRPGVKAAVAIRPMNARRERSKRISRNTLRRSCVNKYACGARRFPALGLNHPTKSNSPRQLKDFPQRITFAEWHNEPPLCRL